MQPIQFFAFMATGLGMASAAAMSPGDESSTAATGCKHGDTWTGEYQIGLGSHRYFEGCFWWYCNGGTPVKWIDCGPKGKCNSGDPAPGCL
ncbi:hypothetical protein DCS_08176 [Drechmeria coniospora]|uniref:Uncharacterized protein n=1 Tax=Drechmeria coniospora TaxID=98403 RepID=A0A151GGH8_DRECN|nr:hypothetical protein DCS_08176 [Drechmeria coniospora]KYK56208.1 hypothetical protein DCS_08176 [Drechmeria coniospora]